MMNKENILSSYDEYEARVGKAASIFILIACSLLLLSTARGFIAIALGGLLEAYFIYNAVFGILLIFTLWCFFDQQRLHYPKKLKLLLYINLIFFICWFLPELFATRNLKFFLVSSMIPFVMFGFMQIPANYMRRMFLFLFILVAVMAIIDFVMANIPSFELRDTRESLRMTINDTHKAPSRVGFYLRVVGIAGSEHETSSLLVMFTTFVLALSNRYMSKPLRAILVYAGLVTLLFTYVASNIVAGVVCVILLVFYYKDYFRTALIAVPLGIFIFYYSLTPGDITKDSDFNIIEGVYLKISPAAGDWSAMLTQETDDSRLAQDGTLVCYYWQKNCSFLFNEFGGLIMGHEGATQMGEIGRIIEVGLLRHTWESGLITALCFYFILIFPILLYFRTDKFTQRQMFPYVCAVAAGILTLWHAGSIFRTSNIFIFYAFYGASIRQYIVSTNFNRSFLDKKI